MSPYAELPSGAKLNDFRRLKFVLQLSKLRFEIFSSLE